MKTDTEKLIEQFVSDLEAAVREDVLDRAQTALGTNGARNGKTLQLKPRKKRKPLTCPVLLDGKGRLNHAGGKECGKPAAPRWLFTCETHKDLPVKVKRAFRAKRKARAKA
jgi:hypothetical protein